jgi:hypothetical protein
VRMRGLHFPYRRLTHVTRAVSILRGAMRRALLSILLVTVLVAPAAVLAADAPKRSGALSIERAMGTIRVTARGGVLGRVDSGSIQFVDLSPNDRWFPVVNGLGRGVVVTLKGDGISFRLLGGQYKLVVRGKGISIAARGHGSAVLDGEPNEVGETGIWAVGSDADCRRAPDSCSRIPEFPRRVTFGSQASSPTQP